MPDVYSCPVGTLTSLYKSTSAVVLSQHLPPLEAARTGDLVGLSMLCPKSVGDPYPNAVDLFIFKSGAEEFDVLPYGDLPDDLQPKAAHLALLLQCDRDTDIVAARLFRALRPLEEDKHACYRLVCLPDAIGVIDGSISVKDPERWGQDRVAIFTWLRLPPGESEHELLEHQQRGYAFEPDLGRIACVFETVPRDRSLDAFASRDEGL